MGDKNSVVSQASWMWLVPQWVCGRHLIPLGSPCVNFEISWFIAIIGLVKSSILHDAWFIKLSFYWLLSYDSRAHCSLLQFLRSTTAILAGAYSYFVLSSFKFEGKNSYHDLIPSPHIIHHNYTFHVDLKRKRGSRDLLDGE